MNMERQMQNQSRSRGELGANGTGYLECSSLRRPASSPARHMDVDKLVRLKHESKAQH